MREAGVLVDHDHNPIFWHVPEDRTAASLPDTRVLWDQIWDHRQQLLGFAHTHPGHSLHAAFPSNIDKETFKAVEMGLGRRLCWWIVTPLWVSVSRWIEPGVYRLVLLPPNRIPSWVEKLRELSEYSPRS